MARKAKKMAAVLTALPGDRQHPFLLTQKEFAALSGQGKMRTKFLRALDACLRKRGYVLIDLHKERQIIGIAHGETIAQWDIPTIHDDIPDDALPEDEGKEQSQAPPAQVTSPAPQGADGAHE